MKFLHKKRIKRLLGLGLGMLLMGQGYAQIPNGDFENFSNTCTPSPNPFIDNKTPFQDGCVADWYPSHGTPQIVKEDNGNHFALMWAGDYNADPACGHTQPDGSEGIMMRCLFKRGETYNFSADIAVFANSSPNAVSSMESIRFYLANDMTPTTEVNYCTGTTNLYELPWVPNKQLGFELVNFSSDWTTITFSITPNDDYEWFWIVPTDWDQRRTLFLDNLRLLTCEESQTYQWTSNLPAYTKRSNFIQTFNEVEVLPNQNVEFIAGRNVTLNPGFVAEPQGVFAACIVDDCKRLECGGYEVDGKAGPEFSGPLSNADPLVYPNPSTGAFTLEYTAGVDLKYTVVGMDGKILLQDHNASGKVSLPLENQPVGLYFLRWESANGNRGTMKLVRN